MMQNQWIRKAYILVTPELWKERDNIIGHLNAANIYITGVWRVRTSDTRLWHKDEATTSGVSPSG
jgi:hypothetical protein